MSGCLAFVRRSTKSCTYTEERDYGRSNTRARSSTSPYRSASHEQRNRGDYAAGGHHGFVVVLPSIEEQPVAHLLHDGVPEAGQAQEWHHVEQRVLPVRSLVGVALYEPLVGVGQSLEDMLQCNLTVALSVFTKSSRLPNFKKSKLIRQSKLSRLAWLCKVEKVPKSSGDHFYSL
jgi:hypothetical protein